MSYNNIKDADLIRPGQQIRIPGVRSTPTPNSGRPSPIPTDRPVQNTGIPPRATSRPVTPIPSDCTAAGEPIYIVRSGDTLSSIGRQFGVPYANIAQRNNFPSSRPIAVSQRLIIPIYGVAPVTSTPTSVNPTPVPDASVPTVQLTEMPAATETPAATNAPDAPTAEIPPSEVSTPEPAAQ